MSKPLGFYKKDGKTRPITPRKPQEHAASYAPRNRARREANKTLPKELRIHTLKKRFNQLNPGEGSDVIDWDQTVGKKETFGETLEDLRYEYPQYRWFKKKDPYEGMAKESLQKEASQYGLEVISKRELHSIKRGRPQIKEVVKYRDRDVIKYRTRWKIKWKTKNAKTGRGVKSHLEHHVPGLKETKRRIVVFVREHNRKWPKGGD